MNGDYREKRSGFALWAEAKERGFTGHTGSTVCSSAAGGCSPFSSVFSRAGRKSQFLLDYFKNGGPDNPGGSPESSLTYFLPLNSLVQADDEDHQDEHNQAADSDHHPHPPAESQQRRRRRAHRATVGPTCSSRHQRTRGPLATHPSDNGRKTSRGGPTVFAGRIRAGPPGSHGCWGRC